MKFQTFSLSLSLLFITSVRRTTLRLCHTREEQDRAREREIDREGEILKSLVYVIWNFFVLNSWAGMVVNNGDL